MGDPSWWLQGAVRSAPSVVAEFHHQIGGQLLENFPQIVPVHAGGHHHAGAGAEQQVATHGGTFSAGVEFIDADAVAGQHRADLADNAAAVVADDLEGNFFSAATVARSEEHTSELQS